MSRRTGFLIAGAIVLGAIALAVLLVSLKPDPEHSEPPPRTPFVETAGVTAGSGAIPVRGAGIVKPSAEIDLAPQVGGRVVWVDPGFRSGGRVEAGQVMFRIDEADYPLPGPRGRSGAGCPEGSPARSRGGCGDCTRRVRALRRATDGIARIGRTQSPDRPAAAVGGGPRSARARRSQACPRPISSWPARGSRHHSKASCGRNGSIRARWWPRISPSGSSFRPMRSKSSCR